MTSGIPPRRTRDGRIYGKKDFPEREVQRGNPATGGRIVPEIFVIMDKDKLNAICAEIDDGMKSFGKNREWDFTAAVRTADTDERTGGQKSKKVSKIERLLADLDKIREK